MKMKAILASLGACAIAVSAMALSASAAIKNANGDDEKTYKTDLAGKDLENVCGLKATITMADGWNESGAGGGIIFNSGDKDEKGSWQQYEWGITGDGTDAKNTENVTISGSDGKFTITYLGANAGLKSDDKWDEAVVSYWWGADFTVDSLVALDKDGNEIGAAGNTDTSDSNATTKAPATTTKAAGATTAASGAKTGDAGVGVAVGALVLAGAAAVVARKKH